MDRVNRWIEKYGIKRVYLVIVSLLLGLGILMSLLVDGHHKQFEIQGVKYHYGSVKDHVWIFKDDKGQAIKVYTEHHQYHLDSDTALYLIGSQGTIKRTTDFGNFSSSIYNNDVLVYKGDLMPVIFNEIGEGELDPKKYPFEKNLVDGVMAVAEHVQSGLFINMILMNLLFIVLGTAQVAFPLFFWHLKHLFDVKGGEPTDFYMGMTRFGGIIMTLAGVFLQLFYL